ncbi:MAG: DUF420 domain-containing protein [Bryobacteraceae bacterium]
MIGLHDLPTVDAGLNATAAVLLVWGYTLIRRRKIAAHKRVMLTAFGVSVAFLICYLTYHAQVGSVHFQKQGAIRTVYLSILATHTVLAAIVPVLAVITLSRALKAQRLWRAPPSEAGIASRRTPFCACPLKGNFERHRQIARWTLPVWLYVSVTGVVVYVMLYHL